MHGALREIEIITNRLLGLVVLREVPLNHELLAKKKQNSLLNYEKSFLFLFFLLFFLIYIRDLQILFFFFLVVLYLTTLGNLFYFVF